MEEWHSYYELLELKPEATLEEIHSRYRYLKDLYGGDSIEVMALGDEFDQEIRADFLRRLDDAFEKLMALHKSNRAVVMPSAKDMDDELRLWIRQIECFTGPALRAVRERMHVDLKSIFEVTRIQPQFLEDVEREAFESFPAEIYLRSYLIAYARFLSLDTQRVLDDYLPRYRAARDNPVK
ncbi:MAG: helix-turn-helix domain-containing protein [Deltaproteobacteria bacterium]|nr:helix-turn-helix domain-containing protein [Deltaproteobacteria bacterium]